MPGTHRRLRACWTSWSTSLHVGFKMLAVSANRGVDPKSCSGSEEWLPVRLGSQGMYALSVRVHKNPDGDVLVHTALPMARLGNWCVVDRLGVA